MGVEQQVVEAVRRGDLAAVEGLLDRVPGLVERRVDGKATAILTAMYHGRADIAAAFVKRGAKLSLWEACAVGSLEVARTQAASHPQYLTSYAPDGFTALGLAAFFGHVDVVRLLLERGAPVNVAARNPLRVMPLHSACARGHVEVARLLLEAGADPNAKQQAGFAPLHSAAQAGNQALVALLRARGADPRQQAEDGTTPIDLARRGGHADLAASLEAPPSA